MFSRSIVSLLALLAACSPSTLPDEPQSDAVRAFANLEVDDEGDPVPLAPALVTRTVIVDNPHQRRGSTFGHSVTSVDLNGDGYLDLGVGADRRGAVYAMYGAESAQSPAAYKKFDVYTAAGRVTGAPTPVDDQFGFDVAYGQFDEDPADELVVGAPALEVGGVTSAGGVFVVGLGPDQHSVTQLIAASAVSRLGNSVTAADFDGDGLLDVAAGAPQTLVGNLAAGVVLVWFGPLDAEEPRRARITNPTPVRNGNFGHVVVAADAESSLPGAELFVSALGNTSQGIAIAGQVYVFPAPFDPETFIVARDTRATNGDPARFGMHIAAAGSLLAVGAPRKNWVGIEDAGVGFRFEAPGWQAPTFLPHPTPRPNDVHGFRVVVADLIGDGDVDVAVGSLPFSGGVRPNGLWVWVWDGGDPATAPQRFEAPRDAGDHWIQGITAADLVPGGKHELIAGDPTWDRPDKRVQDNVGRVVIYVVEE